VAVSLWVVLWFLGTVSQVTQAARTAVVLLPSCFSNQPGLLGLICPVQWIYVSSNHRLVSTASVCPLHRSMVSKELQLPLATALLPLGPCCGPLGTTDTVLANSLVSWQQKFSCSSETLSTCHWSGHPYWPGSLKDLPRLQHAGQGRLCCLHSEKLRLMAEEDEPLGW
jgi:hypothetical protein